ncbi:ATP synthase F1, epsilon subunit [Elusimicrobium minutum Pei191]|uniref:ATP synthase epsilon chain n=1 Tax=Elusimicrobium minutum (strain Pei191) TaxID=445932 RepID=ATPE_ELUMP|nr:ATP synthase F1 subunit epsilon [Elusimicrobium minutum]B2KEX4.1 RecName: Full=ATP synthase epsilon chain; AltName: Full=ATP synthase F1 sector epsilon subunit; AltName: Full=F-ATPase epsilon subunit [Elusimicrobium minutum Pei191]ACC99070.1 ATP synthase F1, epsilon subunit [Elusimicrobium minutum Pei191]
MKKLTFSFISPERPIVQNQEADFVALPAFEGEMGVLPGHVNSVVILMPGFVRFKNNGEEKEFAIIDGFAEVFKDHIDVFASEASLSEEKQSEEQKQRLERAKKALSSQDADIDIELAEIQLKTQILKMKMKKRKM